MFREHASYWSEKIDSNDEYNYYIICDKSKAKPYRWEVLDKDTLKKEIGYSYSTLEETKKSLEEFKAKLVARKI